MKLFKKTKRLQWLVLIPLISLPFIALNLKNRGGREESSAYVKTPRVGQKYQTLGREEKPSSQAPRLARVRPVYPHSIIEGGIGGAGELRRAIMLDSVVASHFSDFNISNGRIIELPVEKTAYVSYRANGNIYWTKKKVKLAKGEKVITDGKNYARARCGNRISEVSMSPTSPKEPSPEVFDKPIQPKEKFLPAPLGTSESSFSPPVAMALPLAAEAGNSSHRPIPLAYVPGIVGGGIAAGKLFKPDHPLGAYIPPPPGGGVPRGRVPEPSSLILLSSGLTSYLAYKRILKKK